MARMPHPWNAERAVKKGAYLGNRVLGVLRQVCPRCGRGKIFRTFLAMHRACPSCGLEFEREQGYFVGAMYFSYALAVLIVLPVIAGMIVAGYSAAPIYLTSAATLVALAPWLFRYSRVLWLYLDQIIDPR